MQNTEKLISQALTSGRGNKTLKILDRDLLLPLRADLQEAAGGGSLGREKIADGVGHTDIYVDLGLLIEEIALHHQFFFLDNLLGSLHWVGFLLLLHLQFQATPPLLVHHLHNRDHLHFQAPFRLTYLALLGHPLCSLLLRIFLDLLQVPHHQLHM
ncbi:hypothetical protein J1605_000492 [Eschrichtius robustus]|uniref:Uncharacterized protein n=1 Tax=Eschrichtius robustus TaxID=9764 RepID=A0AB34H644_ESCRO|nr:hypothetical protein J1605_000492 [Eschrichtius robustus]